MADQLCKKCQLWTALHELNSAGVCFGCMGQEVIEAFAPDIKVTIRPVDAPAPTGTDTADYTPQMDKYATQFSTGVMGPTYFPSELVFETQEG